MRSVREIRFRLMQKLDNVRLYVFQPSLSRSQASRIAELPLPDPRAAADSLRGSKYSGEVRTLADEAVAHRFCLFGQTVDSGSEIEWRRDYIHSRVTGTDYFSLIPYLDFEKAGDHKNIWELNRHQHLVVLAQAFLLTGIQEYAAEIERQLASWFDQNPFMRGINFASALEVAFRALSWLWVDHLVGRRLQADARDRLWNGLFQHGHFLQANLSTYFSPNTHLLGEGVALYALGLKFQNERWQRQGRQILAEERDRQIQADGSHFEHSTYYHVYALDFFLFYYLLDGRPTHLEAPLRKMARFLDATQGPAGLLSFLGDDDGGRVFHPYGNRAAFGRATLTTCARLFPDEVFSVVGETEAEQAIWWLGPDSTPARAGHREDYATVFPKCGLVAIARGSLHLLIDTGPFGFGGGGHSHSDTLSFTARLGERELLIDPGTFTYVADPSARDEFRGSASHNTVRVDGTNQADAVNPFRWGNRPLALRRAFRERNSTVYLDAECRYRQTVHRRRYFLVRDRVLFVVDDLTGPAGTHTVEQFWHPGQNTDGFMRIVSGSLVARQQIEGWRSRCLGSREKSPVLVFHCDTEFPVTIATALLFGSDDFSGDLEMRYETNSLRVRVPGGPEVEFEADSAHVVGE